MKRLATRNCEFAETIFGRMVILFSLLIPNIVTAQQGLSPSVQADLLRDKIFAQAKANDADGVLASLDKFHKLVEDNKLAFPPPLYWIEAKAAHDSGDAARALSALTQYLNNSDHGSTQYKEALALYPQYDQGVSVSKSLNDDAKRQALIARIPEVIAQITGSMVTEPGGVVVCPKPGKNAKFMCRALITQSQVASFEVSNRCVPWFWWDVYAADTGRQSPYDQLQGGDGCLYASIATSQDAEKNAQRQKKHASESETWDSPFDDIIIAIDDIDGFVEWISSHTGSHWRFPTTTEFELMYERAVAVSDGGSKGKDSYPALNLARNHCDNDYVSAAPRLERSCGPSLDWELTYNCLPDGFNDNTLSIEPKAHQSCEGKAREIFTINVVATQTIDRTGRYSSVDSMWTSRDAYSEHYLNRPQSYRLSSQVIHYPKSIHLRLVREH